MQPDPEERPDPRFLPGALPAARRRNQPAEAVQHQERLGVVRDRQARAQLGRHFAERPGPPVEHPQQVHEGAVPRQPLRKRALPPVAVECPGGGGREEQPGHRPEVVLAALEAGGVRRAGEVRMRGQHVRDQSLAEELVDPLP